MCERETVRGALVHGVYDYTENEVAIIKPGGGVWVFACRLPGRLWLVLQQACQSIT
jgi:hypothetical protein